MSKLSKNHIIKGMVRKGFTIIELVFVLGILAILMSVILPSFKGLQDETKLTRAQSDLGILQSALEAYYNDNGDYPTQNYQTELLNSKTRLINQNYFDQFQSPQTEYEYYRVSGQPYYILRSFGLNRAADFTDFADRIDLNSKTVTLAKSFDDLVATNLKIVYVP